ncbi:MAG TPA: hypothetical protein VME44_04050 [Streptosporangiaceae bacterium]|nr:hypothetical protein [Streptosporangiaceae bacterium]
MAIPTAARVAPSPPCSRTWVRAASPSTTASMLSNPGKNASTTDETASPFSWRSTGWAPGARRRAVT